MSGHGQVYTITAAAQKMGLGRSTLYKLINSGLIRRTWITPTRPRITEAEITRYLDSVTY